MRHCELGNSDPIVSGIAFAPGCARSDIGEKIGAAARVCGLPDSGVTAIDPVHADGCGISESVQAEVN